MLGSKKASVKAAKEKQLAGETRDKSMDEKFQLELNATCENRAAEFEQRSASQAAEIEAIHKAVEDPACFVALLVSVTGLLVLVCSR